MKYIFYFLLWFSVKNVATTDGKISRRYYNRGQLSGRVVGGVEVPISMYPHVAILVIRRAALCGGSVISDRLILTAGHCTGDKNVMPFKPDAFEAYLGSSTALKGALYKVCKVVPHESYTPKKYFNDIAVLMLNNRIKFGPTIQKVEIAPDTSWRKEKYSFTIAGFGFTTSHGGSSHKLLATRMHYVDSRTCNQSQASNFDKHPQIVPNHMFCMIGQRWTSDCYGDSGSGVIWKRYIVGLVATGRDDFCGADMMPSMYTDVTFFRDWIEAKIKEASALKVRDCTSETAGKLKKQRQW